MWVALVGSGSGLSPVYWQKKLKRMQAGRDPAGGSLRVFSGPIGESGDEQCRRDEGNGESDGRFH